MKKKEVPMKFKLMIISLSPLALLTIIKDFSFELPEKVQDHNCLVTVISKALHLPQSAVEFTLCEILLHNWVLCVVLLLCALWVLAAAYYFVSFQAFKWVDRKSGYEIVAIEEKEDASLNFFLTLIIPLLMDDVATIQGALTFLLIVAAIFALLYRTKLFYANPILAMLGYRIYEFRFKSNNEYPNEHITAISFGRLTGKNSIEYKNITKDGILFVKEMKRSE